MTVLNTGRFAGLLRGQCPETPHSLLWQARTETPPSLDVIPPNVLYLTESFLRSQGMTPDYTTLQAIERYYPNTQAVVLLAGEIGVAYTHVIDSSRQANGIDRMKEQFGYSDGVEFWKARIAKKDE
jgi:hypothetical protein